MQDACVVHLNIIFHFLVDTLDGHSSCLEGDSFLLIKVMSVKFAISAVP